MFYAFLVISGIQFIICNLTMVLSRRPGVIGAILCFLAPLLLLFLGGVLLPGSFFLAIILIVLMVTWKRLGYSSRSFVVTSLLSICLLIGCCSGMVYQTIERLRAEYPVVSLSDRLPDRIDQEHDGISVSLSPLTTEIDEHFDKWQPSASRYAFTRTDALIQLHNTAYNYFIYSPKFGVARMLSPYWRLSPKDTYAEQAGQNADFQPMTLSISEVDGLNQPKMTIFPSLVRLNITEFVPVASLGFIKNRKQVAGFLPHGQRNYMVSHDSSDDLRHDAWSEYALHRLDLISLLLHDPPVAYLTDTLPSMEQVKQLKTRPLDSFEMVGLVKLRGGEDLYAREYQGHTRLLGALRNAKQCMACHDGSHGDLLGAFSYDLTTKGK